MGNKVWVGIGLVFLLVMGCAMGLSIDSVTHGGIVVDNQDSEFSSAGAWVNTTFNGHWGIDYLQGMSVLSSLSDASAWWRPNVPVSKRYNVYVWYPSLDGSEKDANYVVNYSGGQQSFYVNQSTYYAGWYYLGSFNFDSGTTGYVQLTNATRSTTGIFVVSADAVLFEPINQIVVDDGDDFGNAFTVQEVWSISSTPTYFYNTSARFISVVTTGVGSATAIWRPNLPYNGIYQVEVSYPSVVSNLTAARDANFIVFHKNGTESVILPQYAHGTIANHWTVLGTFAFNSGTDGYIQLTNLAPLSDGRVVTADAVRFTIFSPIPAYEGGELRAFWAHGINVVGLRNINEVTAMVNTTRMFNLNAIFAHGRVAGDSYYESAFEPKSSALGANTTFDALSALILLAHDTSGGKKYIEVHAWLNPFRDFRTDMYPTDTTNHLRFTHPEWFDLTSAGVATVNNMQFTHVCIPDNQEYHIKVWMDCVRNYDIDGVQTDDYFFQGSTYGFNAIATSRFASEYGYAPTSSDSTFGAWRRADVTNYVKRFYAEALTVRPNLKWTVAPVASGAMTPYYNSTAYASEFNDWMVWYQFHYYDALVPEVYTGSYNSIFTTNLQFSTSSAKANNRHLYYGQGSYQTATQTGINMLLYSQLTARAHGEVLFDYVQLNSSSNNTAYLYALLPTAYSTPTTTASMPWKSNPPGGIIKGKLYSTSTSVYPYFNGKNVYKGLVTYSGVNGTGSTYSDGNGFYVFFDVPTGTYTVSAYNPPANTGSPIVQNSVVNATRGTSTNADLYFDTRIKDWKSYSNK